MVLSYVFVVPSYVFMNLSFCLVFLSLCLVSLSLYLCFFFKFCHTFLLLVLLSYVLCFIVYSHKTCGVDWEYGIIRLGETAFCGCTIPTTIHSKTTTTKKLGRQTNDAMLPYHTHNLSSDTITTSRRTPTKTPVNHYQKTSITHQQKTKKPL